MASTAAATTQEPTVRVLARGLRILKAFQPHNDWLSNQEIAELTGLPKPTVSRLTATLTTLGYLIYSHPRGRYRLNLAVLELGYFALANQGLCSMARPLMQALANREDALVVLAEHDDMAMLCSEVCHSEHSIVSLRVHRGSRLVLPYSAAGRAYLGGLPAAARQALCDEIARRFPKDWPMLSKGIALAASEVAQHGFCITMGSLENGVSGVGVPVHIPNAPYRYALGCAAPSFHFPRDHLEQEIGPALLAVKRQIELPFTPALGQATR